jgi:tetratricopeptide (TPR) repeat protein
VNRLLSLIFFCLLLFPLTAEAPQVDAYRRARSLQDNREYYAAVEAYTEIVRQYPVYVEPMIGLAESFFFLGEYKDALFYIQRAIKLRQGDMSLQVLHGRILVGLGSFGKAREIFTRIVQSEPNNMEALLGLAELDVAEGRIGNALQTYEEALARVPDERRVILGLLLLSDELERFEASQSYVSAAVRYHGDNPQVQVAVAQHYIKRERFDDALHHARIAISLQQDYQPALRTAARALLLKNEYETAAGYLLNALKVNPDDAVTLYSLGMAYELAGESDKAIRSYTSVFRSRRDDELTRFALESLVKRSTAPDHPLRKTLADYHLERGREFEARFLMNKAAREYRLAVQLLPSDPLYRMRYAQVWKTLGYKAKYLSYIEGIVAEGTENEDIRDELEIHRSLQENSIAQSWGLGQFGLQRNEYRVGVFYIPSESSMEKFAGERVASELFVDFLSSLERITIPGLKAQNVSSFAEAFGNARTRGDEYFILLSFEETARSFTVHANMYMAFNGAELERTKVYRTGNDKVGDAIDRTARNIHGTLPLRGNLLRREFDKGLIDIGALDGLKTDDELLILPPEAVVLSRERLGFEYSETDIVGRFTVTAVDDLVTEGRIEGLGFFDYVNEGDICIIPGDAPASSSPDEEARGGLYQELLTIQ